MITEIVYNHVTDNHILPFEQKGCTRNARGCKEQLLMDKNIMEIVKKQRRDISCMWIDYKKAYDSVPHEWIKKVLTMYKIDPVIRKFVGSTMKSWRLLLSLPNKKEKLELDEIEIKRGIFQGDSFSPLIFCLAMAPLSRILKRAKIGFNSNGKLVNHLKYIDDIKIFAKNKSELKRCVSLVEMFSKDINMKLGIDKCGIVNVVKGKLDEKKFESEIPTLTNDDAYKYLGLCESSDILHEKMKDKAVKEMFKRVRAIAKAKLTALNFVRAYNSFALPILRYGFGILKWTKTELLKLDRKMRKILTKAGFHHPKSNTHRLYMRREDGGRGVKSLWDTYNEECSKIATYLRKNSRGDPLTELISTMERKKPKTISILRFDDEEESMVKKHAEDHLEKHKEKEMHGQWLADREEIASVDVAQSDSWLKYSHLTPATESVLVAAQEQTLATNYVRNKLWNWKGSPLCRLCRKKPETIAHLISGCECLVGTKYTNRHDKVGKYIHWNLLKDRGIKVSNDWFKHEPEKVTECGDTTILWDQALPTDKRVCANRPDITIHNKKERNAVFVDFSVPYDMNIVLKTAEKLVKYKDLEIEIQKCWNLKEISTVPVVVGALGTVSTDHKQYLKTLSKHINPNVVQKTAMLGTANILRGVLSISTKDGVSKE